MSRVPHSAITASLIGLGVIAWVYAGHPLLANPDLKTPLNVLGINRSPYGEVFAMAMQSPVDTYFHAGIGVADHDEDEAPSSKQDDRDHDSKKASRTSAGNLSLSKIVQDAIATMHEAQETRTNPKSSSDALKRYLRRQAEDKLRFAYELDPSHYGNYNSLHFFLTEPELGTRVQLTGSVAKLAEDTIQYCLKQDHDPRPALTAAAACTNVLHLMFNDQFQKTPMFTAAQMRQYMDLLDRCLARYQMIAKEWDETKQWDLLSDQRIAECQDRFHFITKIRDAAEITVIRKEKEAQNQPNSH